MRFKLIALALALILLGTGSSTVFLNVAGNDQTNEIEQELEIPEQDGEGFFTENLGQWDDEILFMGETAFGHIGIGKGSIYFDLREEIITESQGIPMVEDDLKMDSDLPPSNFDVKGNVVKYTFEGANDVVPVGADPKNHVHNYFLGNDPDKWVRGARNFETVIFKELYDDMDLKYYFNEKGPKYDLILKPYSEPDDIRVKVEGQESIEIAGDDLSINLGEKEILQDRDLYSYQENDQTMIGSDFRLIDDDTYGFKLGNYDRMETIVIDPLIFSTFIGGSVTDASSPKLVQDSSLNPILIRYTSAADFPTTPGAYDTTANGNYDIFVTKFRDDGSDLIFSTFIGGDYYDYSYQILLDDNDDIILGGYTYSSDFPTSSGAYNSVLQGTSDYYLLRLKHDGSDLLSSTLIGGTSGDPFYGNIILKDNGNLVVADYLSSSQSTFPTTPGAFDTIHSGSSEGVVFEISADGTTLVFSTYFGGSSTETVKFFDIKPNGEIWIGGNTGSLDFEVTIDAYDDTYNGATDLYFIKMKSDGSDILYSTFIGGTGSDSMTDCIIDDNGDLYFTGLTASMDFPRTTGPSLSGGSDHYVLKMKSDWSGLHFSRVNGGTAAEMTPKILMMSSGEILLEGSTRSSDFPVTSGAFDTVFDGPQTEKTITKFSADGSTILGSTFLGMSGAETIYAFLGPNEEIIAAGNTNSTDFPYTPDAENPTIQGRDIFFIEFKDDLTDIVYGTFIGGNGSDYGTPYYFEDTEDLFISGYSYSADFPHTENAYDNTLSGASDYLLIKYWEGDLEPTEVYNIKTFSDEARSIEKGNFDVGEKVHIELTGLDSNTSRLNIAVVNISFGLSPLKKAQLRLKETDIDTGVFQGDFLVPPGTVYTDTLKLSSRKDQTKFKDIFIEPPYRPSSVLSLEIYSDEACSVPVDKLDKGDTGYAKIIGTDSNPGSKNKALANVTGLTNISIHIPFVLEETDIDSGAYVGSFPVPVDLGYFDNFTVTSVRNDGISDEFMIHTPVQIRPLIDVTTANEDEEYRASYWNFGYETGTWSTSFTAPWLNWDADKKEFYGTPDNNHVGKWDVYIEIEDEKGHIDSHDFQIRVQNTPPNITTENVLVATEGVEYHVDYNSSDDGQGEITWSVIPTNSWFSINENTGVLSGLPLNVDVGSTNVSVIVKDEHNGIGSTEFVLTVIGVNQPPRITSLDIKTGKQGDNFYRDYEVMDPDGDTEFHWELFTDASFLTLDNDTGVLQGVPGPYDVGVWSVNITVSDTGGLIDSHEFELTIEDVRDKPVWADTPEDADILHGTLFTFDVNATDPDIGDEIEYSVWTDPESDLDIHPRTGMIEWTVNYLVFEGTNKRLEINVRASDGEAFTNYVFYLTVIPTESPESFLLEPQEGEKTSSSNTVLRWGGIDPEDELITYTIYIHENQAFVEGKNEDALYEEDYPGTSLNLSTFTSGTTYYWTVIPFDQCTVGVCQDIVRSFKINSPPTLQNIPAQDVKSGKEFKFKVQGTDSDPEDSANLLYSLENPPSGMDISSTGTITWKPTSDQVGTYTLTVSLRDGTETSTSTFELEVIEGEESGLDLMIIILVTAAITLIIGLIILFFVFRKKPEETEVEKDEEEDIEAQIIKEMELHQKEKEWEKEHMKPHEPENDNASVPLSAAEAHAHDKDNRYDQPDYEDLYGQPAPEIEEGDVSTEELRDHIKETVNQLEQMDPPSEEEDLLDNLVTNANVESNDTVTRGTE